MFIGFIFNIFYFVQLTLDSLLFFEYQFPRILSVQVNHENNRATNFKFYYKAKPRKQISYLMQVFLYPRRLVPENINESISMFISSMKNDILFTCNIIMKIISLRKLKSIFMLNSRSRYLDNFFIIISIKFSRIS